MTVVPEQSTLPAFLRQSKTDIHLKFEELEWQQLDRLRQGAQPTVSSEPPSKWARLVGDTITTRNRYGNIDPYASNRVKLKVGDGMNDYINASPIQLEERRFIATQGPKDINVNHFYRMVATEVGNPAVVVMLTQTHEAGREKCFQYYPLSSDESPLIIPPDQEIEDGFQGQVELLSVEHDPQSNSQIRRMRLHASSQDGIAVDKEIYHLLFSGWPDFAVPEDNDRQALVELVRLSASINRAPSSNTTIDDGGSSFAVDLASTDQDNPRIVHCSAGVGRSGTFIALDYLLSLLHSSQLDDVPNDNDPIVETVDRLRQQRMMMVQSEPQFFFLYDTLREHFLARQSRIQASSGAQRDPEPA